MKQKIVLGLLAAILLSLGGANASSFIGNATVFGQDGLLGFLRSFDVFNAEVNVALDSDVDITTGQVKMGIGSAMLPADACLPIGNFTRCSWSLPEESYMPQGATVSFKLFDDDNNLVDETELFVVVDGYPPEVELITPNELIGGSGQFTVNYTIVDTAYDGSELCSGIGGIVFVLPDGDNQSFEINSPECLAEGQVQIGVNGNESSVVVCAFAYDRLQQTSEPECVITGFDANPPEIVDGSLHIEFTGLPSNATVLGPNITYTANVYVTVIDENFDKIIGDFSDLNVNKTNYSMEASSCDIIDIDTYQCVFTGVLVKLLDSGSKNIWFEATDRAGNSAEKAMSLELELDVTGPEPISMIINNQTEELVWVGKLIRNIEVDFVEDGAGLFSWDIMLNLSNISLAAALPADSCVLKDKGLWACYWHNIMLRDEAPFEGVISLNPRSKDALGNQLVGNIEKQVFVDMVAPELVSFNMSQPDAPFELPSSDMFLEGYPIMVTAMVVEDRDLVTVRVQPEELKSNISENTTIRKDCVPLGNNTWYCEYWLEQPMPGYYNAQFVFEDAALNAFVKSVNFTVLDMRNTTTEYWNVAHIERMPSAVDRSTAPYINHEVLFLVALNSSFTLSIVVNNSNTTNNTASLSQFNAMGLDVTQPATSVTLLKVVLLNCTNDTAYLLDYGLIDGSDLGEFPYLEMVLKKLQMPMRSLYLNCEFGIYSLIQSGDDMWVNENPEIKNLSLEIPFYDTELPEQVLQEKISNVLSSPWVELTDSDTFKMAENIVSWGQLFSQMDMSLLKIGRGMAGAAGVCEVLSAGNPFCSFISTFSKGIKAFHQSVAWFEGILSCDITAVDLLFGKDNAWSNVWKSIPNMLGGQIMKGMGYTEEQITNPRRSLVASVALGCIPGVVENLKQLRDIECGYAYCIQESSKIGVPSYYCDEIHRYGQCIAAGEELAYFVPLSKVYEDAALAVNNAATSPLHLVAESAGLVCQFVPQFQPVCDFILMGQMIDGVATAVDAFNNIEKYITSVDYCSLLELPQQENETS